MISLISSIWGGKPWYSSLTTWGLVLFIGASGAMNEACAQGILSESMCGATESWIRNIGIVLTTLGIRRASNPATPAA